MVRPLRTKKPQEGCRAGDRVHPPTPFRVSRALEATPDGRDEPGGSGRHHFDGENEENTEANSIADSGVFYTPFKDVPGFQGEPTDDNKEGQTTKILSKSIAKYMSTNTTDIT